MSAPDPCRSPVPPITFAHRGARAHQPENTLAAFRHALEAGVAGLETDAWTAADGEAVLVHDPVVTVRRGGVVRRRLRVAASSRELLARHDVPRLLDLYRELGADYELSIDLKDETVGTLVLDAARAAGEPRRLWLCSPSRRALRALRPLSDDAR